MYHSSHIEKDFMVVPIHGGAIKFMTYREYIDSEEWKDRVNQYKDEAGWQCSCGSTDHITGHHKTYVNLGNELQEDIEILCWSCHQERHPGHF